MLGGYVGGVLVVCFFVLVFGLFFVLCVVLWGVGVFGFVWDFLVFLGVFFFWFLFF